MATGSSIPRRSSPCKLLAAAFTVAIASPLVGAQAAAPAGDAVVPEVQNSRFRFTGEVNTHAVHVRSGPAENYYPTAKLDKGARLTVVGIKGEWLKIVPPTGSFSVVAKAFVKLKEGAQNVGVVDVETLNVRAGSSVSPLKVTVQCKLKRGAEVEILGEQDEYYKITPPEDAYLYVRQDLVSPVKPIVQKPPRESEPVVERPTTNPVDTNQGSVAERRPATRPVAPAVAKGPSVQEVYDRLEGKHAALAGTPLEKQPLGELLTGYQELLKDDHVPATIRRIAEVRVATLKIRQRNQQELVETLKQQEAANNRIEQLRAARRLLEQRTIQTTIYTAIGTLQASKVQVGGGTLFRVADPSTDRTLCYVRSEDPRAATYIGKFIGVKGELQSDAQLTLKVVPATLIEEVNPSAVNDTVAAQVMPPSMIGRNATRRGVGGGQEQASVERE
jgi:uncharacterized protein YgiM (DUF1202 family)